MSKKLAICGHSTRGEEVIKLLEMMGGSNIYQHDGEANAYSYYINGNVILHDRLSIAEDDDFEIFTLQKFLEKYPFKVGDKVIDKADGCPGIVSEMKWDADVSDMKYCVVFGNGIDFGWFANDSIEFCKEDKNLDETKVESTGFMQVCKTAGIIFNDANYADKVELYLGDYEIVARDGKTFAVKKKPKYPKLINLTECKEILGEKNIYQSVSGYKGELLTSFQCLLIFRDVYWKIAGEELGLDKPWNSKYGCGKWGYWIGYDINANKIYCQDSRLLLNRLLVFPTKEMRDAFCENFKDLIEQCKELL